MAKKKAPRRKRSKRAAAPADKLATIARLINEAHAAVVTGVRTTLDRALTAGELLTAAKGLVEHGQWLSWMSSNCPAVSERTARGYMQLWAGRAVLTERRPVADLIGLRGALKLLGAPRAKPSNETDPQSPKPAKPARQGAAAAGRNGGNGAGNGAEEHEQPDKPAEPVTPETPPAPLPPDPEPVHAATAAGEPLEPEHAAAAPAGDFGDFENGGKWSTKSRYHTLAADVTCFLDDHPKWSSATLLEMIAHGGAPERRETVLARIAQERADRLDEIELLDSLGAAIRADAHSNVQPAPPPRGRSRRKGKTAPPETPVAPAGPQDRRGQYTVRANERGNAQPGELTAEERAELVAGGTDPEEIATMTASSARAVLERRRGRTVH
jgi:hypothetical protein